MAKITYTDKVSTEIDPTIPEINKITDANMNEIKSVVNDNYDYSIYIGDEADATSDTKLLIETDTLTSLGTEITNTYSTSQVLGYSANYVNKFADYSTSEQVVGKWIDGKPLYRKIITGTLTQRSTEVNVSLNASVSTIAKIEGNLLATATGQAFGINYYLNSTSSTYVKVYVNSASANQNTVGIYQNVTGGNVDYFVIVEYTKTTD